MNKARVTAYIVSILAVISSIAVFFLPLAVANRGSLAAALMVAEMHTGATIIYLISLRKFTRKLKIAYGLICAASTLVALGTLQLLVVNAFELRHSAWVGYGGTEFPFLISLFVLYVGYALFGILLGLKFLGKTPWIVAGIAIFAALCAVGVPHVPKLDPEPAVDLSMAFAAAQNICLIFGIGLLFMLRRRAGPLYTPALAWMLLSLSAAEIAAAMHLWQYIFLPDDHWWVVYRIYTLFLGVSGILSLKAALAFSNVPSASELQPFGGKLSFFGRQLQAKPNSFTPVNVIVFAANLASNVRALDPWLDTMREITSKDSQELSDTDRQALAKVYLQIENYLVTSEPVRQYTREELQDIMQSKFSADQSDFWELVRSLREVK